METVVYVSSDDIRDGSYDSCDKCPVALATKRALKKPVKVHFGYKDLRCYVDGSSTGIVLPSEAYSFANKFETKRVPRGELSPFTFTLKY